MDELKEKISAEIENIEEVMGCLYKAP